MGLNLLQVKVLEDLVLSYPENLKEYEFFSKDGKSKLQV